MMFLVIFYQHDHGVDLIGIVAAFLPLASIHDTLLGM
jgi:hypothetical protein